MLARTLGDLDQGWLTRPSLSSECWRVYARHFWLARLPPVDDIIEDHLPLTWQFVLAARPERGCSDWPPHCEQSRLAVCAHCPGLASS